MGTGEAPYVTLLWREDCESLRHRGPLLGQRELRDALRPEGHWQIEESVAESATAAGQLRQRAACGRTLADGLPVDRLTGSLSDAFVNADLVELLFCMQGASGTTVVRVNFPRSRTG